MRLLRYTRENSPPYSAGEKTSAAKTTTPQAFENHPALYGGEFSRVYRNNLIAALALVALGLSFNLARRLDRARVRVAAGHALGRGDLVLSALFGLCFGLLWTTRLDVHWIALGCGAALAVSGWPLLRRVSSTLRVGVPLLTVLIAKIGRAHV